LYQEGFINTGPVRGGFDFAWHLARLADLNVFAVNPGFCNRMTKIKVSMSDQITGNTYEKISGRTINDSPGGIFSCEHGGK
jgi:hypothetical protein